MNQWTQKNVKFKVTINQWYLYTTTQWQQSHGVVAGSIAAAVDFAPSNGGREFFLVIKTINQWQRPEMPCSAATTAANLEEIISKLTMNWGKW